MKKTNLILLLYLVTLGHNLYAIDPIKGTYNAGTGSCGGAPRILCDSLSSIRQSPLTISQQCDNNPGPFGSPINMAGYDAKATLVSRNQLSASGSLRFNLDKKPSWVISAAWSLGEQNLIMVDLKNKAILTYDLAGHLKQRTNFDQNASPAFITRLKDGGFIVKDTNARMAWLDHDLGKTKKEVDVRENSTERLLLDWVWDWAPLGNNLLAFGDIKIGSTNKNTKKMDWVWRSALVRTSLDQPSCIESIQDMELNNPARNFYLMGYPLLASVNNKGYALVMNERPYILEVGLGARNLKAFPVAYGRPKLPAAIDKKNVVLAYETMERSRAAVGLIGWNGSLYVLTRQPIPADHTKWQIWRVDPEKDMLINRPIDLPTSAQHIILVPGDRNWAIIEKGSVIAPLVQDVHSVVLVPASTFLPTISIATNKGAQPEPLNVTK